MGFRLNRTYALRFEGALEGLEVDIKGTSVAAIMELREAGADRIAEMLAEHVIHWNYEDEAGETLPITAASFLSLEEVVLAEIGRQWYRAAVGVTAPLEQPSTNTEPSVEPFVPTEAL